MFTGIVEELGDVVGVDRLGTSARLAVRGPVVTGDVRPGESIAVNGVCLTVVAADRDVFTADVMAETLHRSTLGGLSVGDRVNLERAVTLSSRLGGHLVQGHVDGVGAVVDRRVDERWTVLRLTPPTALVRYVVEKGSIAVDGVSLTVSAVAPDDSSGVETPWFEVSLVPATLAATTLGRVRPGAPVNLEVDMIAKYVEKLLRGGQVGQVGRADGAAWTGAVRPAGVATGGGPA